MCASHTTVPQTWSEIVVQTRRGNCVENAQCPVAGTYGQDLLLRRYETKYPFSIYRTTTVSGMYNCHGMTLASRRTGIHKPAEVDKILEDDGYVRITRREDVLPGDLVLYRASDGDIPHSGIVLETPNEDNLYNPDVMSKWGDGPEIIHRQSECPYTQEPIEYYYCRIVS